MPARLRGGVGAGAYGQRHDDGAGHVRRSWHPPVVGHLRRRRPRDHRRQPRRVRHHRDRCGQGARRRGGRRVPDPGQPRCRHPGVHLGAHRHHRLHGGRRTAHRVGPTGVPRVRRRFGARRAQRRLRHLVPQGGGPAHRARVARLRGARHRAPGPAAGAPRRGAQPSAGLAGAALPRHDHPRPPGPARRPGHRRRAARPVRAGRLAGRALPRGAARLHRPGHPRPAPQAAPRRRPARPAGGLPVQGRPGPGALRRHLGLHPHPGAVLLHGLRAPPPDGRDGAHRRVREPHRLRHHPRGRGARAAAHRRAQAALQPALAPPRAGAVGEAHRRAVPPPVDRAGGRARRRPVCRAVQLPAPPPRPRWPPCTKCCRCASASNGCPPPGPGPRACSPRWAGAAPPAPGPSRWPTTPSSPTGPSSCSSATPATCSTPCAPG